MRWLAFRLKGGERLGEMLPHGFEGLWEDPGVPENRHEIRVAAPSGDNVLVEVFGHACSGGFSEVYADIEAVWLEGFLEKLFSFDCRIGEAESFFLAKILNVRCFSIWKDEKVTCVVGVSIHEDKAMLLA